jgi:hypothetical protein
LSEKDKEWLSGFSHAAWVGLLAYEPYGLRCDNQAWLRSSMLRDATDGTYATDFGKGIAAAYLSAWGA